MRPLRYLTGIGLTLAALLVLAAPGAQAAPTPFFNAIGLTGPTNLPPLQSETQRLGVEAEGGTFTLAVHHVAVRGRGEFTPSNGFLVSNVETSSGAFAVGQGIEGAGIRPGTTITAVGSDTLTISTNSKPPPGTSLIATDAGVETTDPLAFDAEASEVEAALNSLSLINAGGGSVSVLGGPGDKDADNPYLITFDGGPLTETDAAQLSVDSSLTGSRHHATVSTTVPGGPGTGKIAMYVQNIGGKATSGTITGKITLPAGIVTSATPRLAPKGIKTIIGGMVKWACDPTDAGQIIVTCTSEIKLPPGAMESIEVPLMVERGSGSTSAEIEFSGGGTLSPAKYTIPITVSAAAAAPGIQAFSGGAYNDDGTPATQAGGHPYSASAALFATTIRNNSEEAIVPAGNAHDIDVAVPPGFVANPRSALRCDQAITPDVCAVDETIIGTAAPVIFGFGESGYIEPAVNSIAPKGYPAGFRFKVADPEIQVNGTVRSDSDYGIEFGSRRTLEFGAVYGSFFTFWGVPADPEHDIHRCPNYEKYNGTQCASGRSSIFAPTALVTNATDCQGHAERTPVTTLRFDVWAAVGNYHHASVEIPPVSGCEKLKFEADLSLQPQKTEAATPSAFDFEVKIPQEGLLDADKLVTPELKHTVVTLPQGVGLNPASAAGLGACSTAQMGLIGTNFGEPHPIRFNKAPVTCPENSKLGTFEIGSPLLDLPLQGIVYLAAQDDNPFNTTIALYLVIEDEQTGLTFKLPGKAIPDPVTGQVISTFPNNPQLPFESLVLHFKGGNLAPLATPEACGAYATDSEVTPWSYPQSGPPFHDKDAFAITSGVGGSICPNSLAERPFRPTLKAGTTSTQAGAFTGLQVKISRQDGEQDLSRLSFTLPAGVSGKLAGIPYCSEAQIKTAESSSGKAEQQRSACPAASKIGSLVAGAGIGANPYFADGKLYMTGPYKGAPISTVAIIPAVAGPYDLGNVVVRTPLYIDRTTAKATATSDPLPYILKGIPLHLRSIKIDVDRPGFVVNPTSCNKMSIAARMTGSGGDNVSAADDVVKEGTEPFQVGGCNDLAFKPKLKAHLKGGTKRSDHPAFTATVLYPPGAGYANTKDVQVTLPHSEFLDQAHINTICTRVQAAANACPAGAIYGFAEATTPLLDGKLTGPVFLKSSVHKLPDLAIALKGPENQPIEVEFQGRIDSIKGQIRNTIEGLPDVPVSRFTLKMKGGRKGLLVNSRNLCKGKVTRMTVKMAGQNSKGIKSRPPLTRRCGKKAGKKSEKQAGPGKTGR